MRGIDTNILVRFLTVDDSDQFQAVETLLERSAQGNDRLHVTSITLCEVAWVLRSSYRMSRAEISSAFQSLLGIAVLESRIGILWSWLWAIFAKDRPGFRTT